MLLGDFFKINDSRDEEEKGIYSLELNPGHAIFQGHFPNMPVVPGVCMMQMVKEIIEYRGLKKTRLIKAGNLKFLSILNPQVHQVVTLELLVKPAANEGMTVTAKLYSDSTTFFKMDALLQVAK